jgi:CBS domain-containing protein
MKDENVGSIPVVEEKGSNKLVGIVTDRDLAIQVVATLCDPRTTTVAEVMTQQLVTCHADDDLQVAMDAMAQHQLRRLPVVDSDYKILGIISQADIATRIDHPEETARVVKEISQPPIEGEPFENKGYQGNTEF